MWFSTRFGQSDCIMMVFRSLDRHFWDAGTCVGVKFIFIIFILFYFQDGPQVFFPVTQ